MLKIDIEQLEELMKSLYTMSGIRFTLFDTDFKEVISYPEEGCYFCRLMKSHPKTRRKCNYTDRRSFAECEKENSLMIYKCHAGLTEAVMPLHENEKIIGYLMFGQLTDNPDKTILYNKLHYWNENCGINKKELTNAVDQITFKTYEQIRSAAKIMEACTSYIFYKELIVPQNSRVIESAKAYIEEHLDENIDITALCREIGVGRTKLYEIFRLELNTGISKYILRRRMHKAKKLLKSTDLSVKEIANRVGFDDYNYFSRVFKKTYGKSPKSYR